MVDEDTTEDQKFYHTAILNIFADKGDIYKHGNVNIIVPGWCEVEEGLFGPIIWEKSRKDYIECILTKNNLRRHIKRRNF